MPDLSFCCIVNPTAGRGRTARLWPEIEKVLHRAGLRFRTFFTEGRGHARELAQRIIKRECGLVVAVGGDGTINEVVNGIVSGDPYPEAALAVLPTGSGNDLCRTLGIGGDPLATARTICSGHYRMLDLGMVEDRYFLNICGIGFDAEVANAVNQGFRWLKGTWAYLAGVLKTLMRFRPVPLEITLDGNPLRIKGLMVAVANGSFFGSGIKIAPRARVDDGLFDVCVVGDIGRLELLRVLPLTYSGRHENHPAIHFFRAREVTVSSPERRLYIQGDGELLGETPAAFHLHRQALRVLVPDNGAGREFSERAG